MLSKKNRLNHNASFNYLYRKGKAVAVDKLVLYHAPGSTVRVGFSVSNKIGKAVIRNYLKRRLRAAMRDLLPRLRRGMQIVFVAKPNLDTCTYDEIRGKMEYLLVKAGLLDKL